MNLDDVIFILVADRAGVNVDASAPTAPTAPTDPTVLAAPTTLVALLIAFEVRVELAPTAPNVNRYKGENRLDRDDNGVRRIEVPLIILHGIHQQWWISIVHQFSLVIPEAFQMVESTLGV